MKRETLRHPKIYDFASRLDVSRSDALGKLILLWDYTGEVALQGDIGKWPNGAIARACDWEGDPDKFIGSLIDSGWLDEDDGHRLLIHDWPDHCETWVRKKLERAKLDFCPVYDRVPGLTVHNSTGVPPARHRSATGVQDDDTGPPTDDNGVPSDRLSEPNPTEPNQSEPNRTEVAPPSNDSEANGTANQSPVVFMYPTNGAPAEWALYHSLVDEWQEAYPSLDVLAECREAREWIKANTRQTARGMKRFLVNWLNRSNDRGPARRPTKPDRPKMRRLEAFPDDH